MEHTRELFKALVADDYSTAKKALHDVVTLNIADRIEKRKNEIRDELSTDED